MRSRRHSKHCSALVLIDFQRDFLSPTGRMPVDASQADEVVRAALIAVAEASRTGDLIIAVGNEFDPRDHLMNLLRRKASIRGSRGAEWDPRINLEGTQYFSKWASSVFVNPSFEAHLDENDIGRLVLTGLFAKACIAATTKDALARGFSVELLSGAIACSSNSSRRAALARLERQGARIVRDAELSLRPLPGI